MDAQAQQLIQTTMQENKDTIQTMEKEAKDFEVRIEGLEKDVSQAQEKIGRQSKLINKMRNLGTRDPEDDDELIESADSFETNS